MVKSARIIGGIIRLLAITAAMVAGALIAFPRLRRRLVDRLMAWPAPYAADDKLIASKVKVELSRALPRTPPDSLVIDATDGSVRLSGLVPTATDREAAEAAVRSLPEVRRVINEIVPVSSRTGHD